MKKCRFASLALVVLLLLQSCVFIHPYDTETDGTTEPSTEAVAPVTGSETTGEVTDAPGPDPSGSAEAFAASLSRIVKENGTGDGISGMDGGSTRIIVKEKADLTGFSPVEVIEDPYGYKIYQFATPEEATAFKNTQEWNPEVQFAEEDGSLGSDGNDVTELSTGSWGTSYVEASALSAHVRSKGKNSRTVVAVVDTGVELSHSMLASRIESSGIDYVDGDTRADDMKGHGTHVAGIIVDCTQDLDVMILPVRVLNENGKGSAIAIANGVRYAADRGASVINLSLGGPKYYAVIHDAIVYAIDKGSVVCIAAGNDYGRDTADCCPACETYPGAVVVSSLDKKELLSDFSNVGASVDVCAPGGAIMSSVMGNQYGVKSGTSMATPHIAAEAAMLCQLYPYMTPSEIEGLIKTNVKDLGAAGRDDKYGAGAAKFSLGTKDIPVTVTSVELLSGASKRDYYTGDTTDTAGVSLKVSYSDKTVKTVNSGFSVSPDRLNAAGSQTVTLTYGGKSVTYTVNVTQTRITELKIAGSAKVTQFFIGSRIDTTGLVLEAGYNNGSKRSVTSGYTVSPAVLDKAGVQTVTVTYDGMTVKYDVTVSNITLSKIEIKTQPSKKNYTQGERLDTAGLVLSAIYNDGSKRDFSSGYTYSPSLLNKAGSQTVTVTYNGKTATFTVNVAEPVVLSSVTVSKAPDKTVYMTGEKLDTKGLTLILRYSDGTTRSVTGGFTCSPDVFTTAGQQAVTVSYDGKSAAFTVTVKEPAVLSSISVSRLPSKTVYVTGEKLDTSGMQITLNYSDGTKQTLTEGFTCSPVSLGTVGTQKITVTYGKFTADFNVTVNVAEVSSIEVKTHPSKTVYYVGDVLDPSGLSIVAVYNNGERKTVTDGFECTADMNAAGSRQVTVSYAGKSASFTVNVKAPSVTGLTPQYRMAPGVIKTFNVSTDPAGLNIKWTVSGDAIELFDKKDSYVMIRSVKAGSSATLTGTVEYNGRTFETSVSVTVPTPSVQLGSLSYTVTFDVHGDYDRDILPFCYKTEVSRPSISVDVASMGDFGDGTYDESDLNMYIGRPDNAAQNSNIAYFSYWDVSFKQPGTYDLPGTVYYNGVEIITFTMRVTVKMKMAAASNGNYLRADHYESSKSLTTIPSSVTNLAVSEIWLSGKAYTSGTYVWGKVTYNGKTGWAAIFHWK